MPKVLLQIRRSPMTNLREGLQSNELDYLVLPLVSIDEYKSKIDDRKAIVVGFYVTESDPAYDLATFIEKGTTPVLDTDVSPAPTTDGYYLVFVELDRDDKFPERIVEIIDVLDNITNVEDWQFSPYGSKEKDNYDLTIAAIKQHINLDPDSIEIEDDDEKEDAEPTDESFAMFFGDALFESVELSDNRVVITDNGYKYPYLMVERSEGEPNLPIIIPAIDDPTMAESRKLQGILGNSYQVYPTNDGILVTNDDGYVVLKTVD